MQLTMSVIFVDNIEVSKEFYEVGLGQKISLESGESYAAFESGFAIWDKSVATKTVFGAQKKCQSDGLQLCFESDKLEEDFKRLCDMGAGVISKIEYQPWGQMAFRVFDPDGHILEIAEPLSHTIERFLDGGYSYEQIATITNLPIDVVSAVTPQEG